MSKPILILAGAVTAAIVIIIAAVGILGGSDDLAKAARQEVAELAKDEVKREAKEAVAGAKEALKEKLAQHKGWLQTEADVDVAKRLSPVGAEATKPEAWPPHARPYAALPEGVSQVPAKQAATADETGMMLYFYPESSALAGAIREDKFVVPPVDSWLFHTPVQSSANGQDVVVPVERTLKQVATFSLPKIAPSMPFTVRLSGKVQGQANIQMAFSHAVRSAECGVRLQIDGVDLPVQQLMRNDWGLFTGRWLMPRAGTVDMWLACSDYLPGTADRDTLITVKSDQPFHRPVVASDAPVAQDHAIENAGVILRSFVDEAGGFRKAAFDMANASPVAVAYPVDPGVLVSHPVRASTLASYPVMIDGLYVARSAGFHAFTLSAPDQCSVAVRINGQQVIGGRAEINADIKEGRIMRGGLASGGVILERPGLYPFRAETKCNAEMPDGNIAGRTAVSVFVRQPHEATLRRLSANDFAVPDADKILPGIMTFDPYAIRNGGVTPEHPRLLSKIGPRKAAVVQPSSAVEQGLKITLVDPAKGGAVLNPNLAHPAQFVFTDLLGGLNAGLVAGVDPALKFAAVYMPTVSGQHQIRMTAELQHKDQQAAYHRCTGTLEVATTELQGTSVPAPVEGKLTVASGTMALQAGQAYPVEGTLTCDTPAAPGRPFRAMDWMIRVTVEGQEPGGTWTTANFWRERASG